MSIKLVVTDNQMLDPPVGGGRVRIYNLYRFLPGGIDAAYVGAYDCKGLVDREQVLDGRLKETIVQLSALHYFLDNTLGYLAGRKIVRDVTIPLLMRFTPRFLRVFDSYATGADVLVLSHPWMEPYLKRKDGQVLIYDSHNCEYNIKRTILGDSVVGRWLCGVVRRVEEAACTKSDAVLACSEEDKAEFVRHYKVPPEKVHIIPNGVPAGEIVPATTEEKRLAKKALGLDGAKTALFIGSGGWMPNTEAAAFIIDTLAKKAPECTFLIIGGVRESYLSGRGAGAGSLHLPGSVIEGLKPGVYIASDCHELEKWGEDYYARWAKDSLRLLIKGADPGKFSIEVLPKVRSMTVSVNNGPAVKTRLTPGAKNICEFDSGNGGLLDIMIKAKAGRASKEDPRMISFALNGVSFSAGGARREVRVDRINGLAEPVPGNVRLFGVVDEDTRKMIYKASDMALNPMSKGSGTNIKMLDYMAAGLPVISTRLGTRGIDVIDGKEALVCPLEDFEGSVKRLMNDGDLARALGENARKVALERFDWKVISKKLADVITEVMAGKGLKAV
ncbi:MAG: glycosyltransferase family 4 protein [Deltaproteobacteria bacterium]|nr:glycosyltransferase family 4 protein [Deltaproteobacteria bacterium]